MEIAWTDYFRYRAARRGFDLARIEEIVKHSVFRPGGSFMSKPRLVYFEKEDVLHLVVKEGPDQRQRFGPWGFEF